ncbi:hypothetical protein IM700_005995 [Paenibacillus sp. DXFW5]|uniref:Lipoprotein n=1 Tax=Paenibacillus rhizolycopersici TaxID=2780073 RepID=A0ABS2H1G6_9BACL|nr:hypothetical protein [Paenibacillus rhizolycopersici]MBM6995212.1 hypothetical protein [Paenibacillus rhizolycopersici]
MKKFIIYPITACVLLAFLVLAGCEGKRSEMVNLDNHLPKQEIDGISIQTLPMEDEEYAVLKAAGAGNSMVFEVNLGEIQADRVHVWIDQYVNGESKGSILGLETLLDQAQDNPFRLYLTTPGMNEEDKVWTLAYRQRGNVTSSKFEIPKGDFDSMMIHTMQPTTVNPNETTVLGVIVRNKGKDHVESSDDVDALIRENQEVHVLRCTIVKDK